MIGSTSDTCASVRVVTLALGPLTQLVGVSKTLRPDRPAPSASNYSDLPDAFYRKAVRLLHSESRRTNAIPLTRASDAIGFT